MNVPHGEEDIARVGGGKEGSRAAVLVPNAEFVHRPTRPASRAVVRATPTAPRKARLSHRPPSRRRPPVPGRVAPGRRTGLCLVAGTTLASSLWWPWPWANSGLGSALPGRRLADLALAGDADAFVPAAVGFGWYGLAAAGALLVALAAIDGPVAAIARGATVAVAVTATTVVLVALGAPPWQFGPTAWVVTAALVAAAAPSCGELRATGVAS